MLLYDYLGCIFDGDPNIFAKMRGEEILTWDFRNSNANDLFFISPTANLERHGVSKSKLYDKLIKIGHQKCQSHSVTMNTFMSNMIPRKSTSEVSNCNCGC